VGIAYSTHPRTFDELCESVRGQVERARELGIVGEMVPFEEAVELTSESMLGLLDRVRHLSEIATHQATMFQQLNDILQWLFIYLDIPILEDNATDESN